MDQILVTGATGFIGSFLCRQLHDMGYGVTAARRSDASLETFQPGRKGRNSQWVAVGEIGPDTNWKEALTGVSTVYHLAGRAHVLRETSKNPLEAFRRVNVLGTEKLLDGCVKAGVRRFLFLSSIGVNGKQTPAHPFTNDDTPNPHNDYALSKLEAEEKVREYSARSDLETVIVRPPLVYGPGVKANFLMLLRAIDKGLPLPFGKVANRRNLVGIRNLADFMIKCLNDPGVPGRTFLVSDDEAISTPELILILAKLMGRKPRLLSVPPALVKMGLDILGKRNVYDGLCLSLQIDTQPLRDCIGWRPPVTLRDGLAETVTWFTQNA